VGNTVDIARASWTNTIGAPELIAVVAGFPTAVDSPTASSSLDDNSG
jgi:hypothetical protein